MLCEKPLARTGAEGEQMVRAAAKAGRVLQIAFNHRERGDVHTLKQHIDDGGLGDIYYAKTRWVRRSGIPGLGSWFTNKEMSGGGPMIDLGVHMLDLTLFLLGEPQVTSVSANTYSELGSRGRGGSAGTDKQQVGSGFEVEDLGTAFLRLAGGATLLLEASWATYRPDGDDFGVTLYGTEGGAEINVPNYAWEDTLRLYSDVADAPAVIAPRVGRGEGHRAVVRSFVEKVRGDDWAQHIGTDALARARIIDACYASAREGREVAVAADSIGVGRPATGRRPSRRGWVQCPEPAAPLFRGNGRIEYVERSYRRPGAGELLVSPRANALCGTDRGFWSHGADHVPGHETAGVVLEAGDATTTPVGTRGVVYLMDFCGDCRSCRLGATNQCLAKRGDMGIADDGGYGPYEVVHESNFFPITDDIDFATATMLLDVMGTSGHAITRARLLRTDITSVYVAGAGPIGLGLLVMSKLLLGQHIPVYISDVSAWRREFAGTLGGIPVDVTDLSPVGGPDVAFDASGKEVARRDALDILGRVACWSVSATASR